jgi:hypothetical protein
LLKYVGDEMRRSLAPWIILAVFGLVAGGAYRYFADDSSDATFVNYLRSGIHGMGLALSGWAVHLYFTSRSSEWVRRWPLVIELIVQSAVMAIVVATVAVGLQAALYGHRTAATWLIDDFPRIVGVAFVLSVVIGAVFELTRLVGRCSSMSSSDDIAGQRESNACCCFWTSPVRRRWRNRWASCACINF